MPVEMGHGGLFLAVFAVGMHDGIQAPVEAVFALGVGDAAHVGVRALAVALPGGFRGLQVKEEFVFFRFLFCHIQVRPFFICSSAAILFLPAAGVKARGNSILRGGEKWRMLETEGNLSPIPAQRKEISL